MPPPSPTPRSSLLSGGIAMIVALVAMRVVATLTGARSLVDSLADGVLLVLPVDLFDRIKTALGDQAKTWLFIGILIAFVLVGSALGRWIGNREETLSQRAFQAAALLLLLAVALVYWIDQSQLRDDFVATTVTLIAGALLFAGAMIWQQRPPVRGETFSASRRSAVATIVGVAGAILLGNDVRRLWQKQASTSPPATGQTAAITPNSEFYTISKNFDDPQNNREPNWSITVSGEADHPGDWTFEQFRAMGEKQTITTMLCISNMVGGDLIGTAEWNGVPMATVLDEIGAAGDYVIFHGADEYLTSVPMDRCRHPQAWLVWGMNGEPLPREHGAPVRAIIPGLYGMKSVKWLTGIEPSLKDKLGYWEQRNWTNTAKVKPMSRIDFPNRSSSLTEGNVPVRGIAFGGDGGLQKVEVSTDGGDSWNDATITEQPNPDGIAWSLWQFDWNAPPGTHALVVRMVTSDGTVQTEDSASPLPDGSSGWHSVDVYVNRS